MPKEKDDSPGEDIPVKLRGDTAHVRVNEHDDVTETAFDVLHGHVGIPEEIFSTRDITVRKRLGNMSLDQAPENRVSGILRQAGRELRCIHNVVVDGFGVPDRSGVGSFDTFHCLLSVWLDKIDKSLPDLIVLPPSSCDRMTGFLSDRTESFAGGFHHPVLVHGDMGPNAIRVHENGMFAGFDGFHKAFFGLPSWDIACSMFSFDEIRFSSFMDGYGAVDMEEVVFFGVLKAALDMIDHAVDRDTVIRLQARTEKLMEKK